MAHVRADSAQVLLINNAEAELEPVLQVLGEFPELVEFPASPIEKTTFKTIAITADPVAAFRAANAGRETTRPTIANKTVTCKFLDASWDIDDLVVQECDRSDEETLALYRASSLRGAFAELCAQIWYGTDNDANGFAGISSLYPNTDSTNVVDATGSGAVTSAYFVRYNLMTAFALCWGKHANMDIGEVESVRIADSNNKFFWGQAQKIQGWCGLQLIDLESAVRICNLTAAAPLTDTLLYAAYKKFRTSKKPDALWLNRDAYEQLRKSRTATNATGAPAPLPDFVCGDIPVKVTDSILSTETALTAAST